MAIRHTDFQEFRAPSQFVGATGDAEVIFELPAGATFRSAQFDFQQRIQGDARFTAQPGTGDRGRLRFAIRWWVEAGPARGSLKLRVRVEYDVPCCRILLQLKGGATFLAARQGGGSGLVLNAQDSGPNSWFVLVCLDHQCTSGSRFHLVAPSGHYVRADAGGVGPLIADALLPDESCIFLIKKTAATQPDLAWGDEVTIYTKDGRAVSGASTAATSGGSAAVFQIAGLNWLDARRPLVRLSPNSRRFQYFEDAFAALAGRHDVPLVQYAIARNGSPVLVGSLGFQDRDRTRFATSRTVMRIASVDKPMVRAAVEVWMRDPARKVTKQTPFFRYLRDRGIQPAGPVRDPRVWDITFLQMLRGASGLDTDNLDNDADSPEQQAAMFMARPLRSAPGTEEHYPNREYELLRLALYLERGGAGGYLTFLRNEVFQHSDVFLSAEGASNRNPRECEYVGAIGYPKSRPLLVATTAEALVCLYSRFRIDDGRPTGLDNPLLCAIEILDSAGKVRERLNCGGPKLGVANGKAWEADKQPGGFQFNSSLGVAGTPFPTLFDSLRIGGINYFFPLEKGGYTVRLFFVEPWVQLGQRRFNLHINENTVLWQFDISEAAGGLLRPLMREFRVAIVGTEGLRIAASPDPKGPWGGGAHYFGGMNGTVAIAEQLEGGLVGAAIANQRDGTNMDWMREILRAAVLLDETQWP